MLKPARGQRQPGAAPAALADLTYDAPVTFHMNGEDVQLIPVPLAHTDGDTMVYFPKAQRDHDRRLLPLDRLSRTSIAPTAASMNGMLAGFDAIVDAGRSDTKIVPGHGAVVDKTAVAAHAMM